MNLNLVRIFFMEWNVYTVVLIVVSTVPDTQRCNLFHKRFPDSQLVVNVTSEKDDFISTFATADDGDGKIVKWMDCWHGQKIAGRL